MAGNAVNALGEAFQMIVATTIMLAAASVAWWHPQLSWPWSEQARYSLAMLDATRTPARAASTSHGLLQTGLIVICQRTECADRITSK